VRNDKRVKNKTPAEKMNVSHYFFSFSRNSKYKETPSLCGEGRNQRTLL